MPFTKVSEKITDLNKFASVVRNYLVASGHFTLHKIFTDTYFSLRHKNGKWFVFAFTNDAVTCFLSFAEPTQEASTTLTSVKGGMYEITYPLLNLYLITTKTFIAISAEVRSSVFRHMLIGRMESYTNRPDGEFLYSTNSLYDSIGNKTAVINSNYSFYSDQIGNDYYYAQGIIGHAISAYSGFKNYVAYNNSLVVSGAGNNNISIDKFISTPPTNVLNGSMNFNGRSPLNTHHLMYSAQGGSLFLKPMFYCNELATIAIDNLSPADIVLDDWIVFPVMTRLQSIKSDEVSTGNLGVAFKFK